MGFKCSNLTNRGIVKKGAFKYIRHPHYFMKLLIWWITFMPIVLTNPEYIIGMLFWTMVYILRAKTEEKHLLKDKDYLEYSKEVKYMFIPKIF